MSDYCDIPEFYHETFPKARKRYRCCECRARIEKGEIHLSARGKNDGEFWHERQHMACRELCMYIRDFDECICFGELMEYWRDSDWAWDRSAKVPRGLMAIIRKRERASAKAALDGKEGDSAQKGNRRGVASD